MTWQKRQGDDHFLDLVARGTGLDHSAILRLALREYAYTHGFALPESVDVALSLREVITALRISRVHGAGDLVDRGMRMLKRHDSRLRRAYGARPYPSVVQDELLQEEQRLRRETVSSRKQKGE